MQDESAKPHDSGDPREHPCAVNTYPDLLAGLQSPGIRNQVSCTRTGTINSHTVPLAPIPKHTQCPDTGTPMHIAAPRYLGHPNPTRLPVWLTPFQVKPN